MASFLKLRSSSGRFVRPSLVFFLIVGLLTVFVSLASLAYAATPAEEGRAIFEQKCKGCHSIGGGRVVGPDLKGVTSNREADWLVRFITSPDKVISQGDPIAKQLVEQYGVPMPNLGISEADAKAIIAYLEAQSSGTTSGPVPQAPAALPPGDAGRGEALFTGKLPLTNGGPACLSCHNISSAGALGGGTMGKDLTSYSAVDVASTAFIIRDMPISSMQVMKEIYSAKPLSDTEVSDIAAFLKSVPGVGDGSTRNRNMFLIIGAISALIIIGLFQLLWRGRLSGVRRPLVKGGSR